MRDVYVMRSAETFSRFLRSPFPDFISLNRRRNINCFNLLCIYIGSERYPLILVYLIYNRLSLMCK